MATDPSGIIAQLLSNGGVNAFGNGFQQGIQNQQQNVLGQQQIAANDQKAVALAQAQQAAQAQAAAKAQAYAAYQADPSHENLTKLAYAAPDESEALYKGAALLDDDARKSQTTQNGILFNLAADGSPDQLASHLTGLISAEKNAGIDTSDAQASLDDLNSGDATRIANARKAITAQTRINLSTLGAKGFEIDPNEDGDAKAVTFGSGGVGHYEGTKFVVDQAPQEGPKDPRDNYIEVKNADGTTTQRYIGGGGDPASSGGGAPTGRTTGGWTPRQANGGDNSDAAVDGKIAGASQFLGVSPTADISTISPMKIAQAMTLSEGGAGSIADRNNNPANLRNSDGSYKVFPTKQAGLAAAAALVARKLKNGQTTVATMIQGLPAGGGNSGAGTRDITGTPAPSANIVANDISTVPPAMRAAVQAIADGRSLPPRPGTRNGEALLDAVTAYDPTFDASNAASRVKTRVDFTTGKSAQNITAMNTAMGHLIHLDDQAHDLGNFSTLPGIVNPIYNSIRANVAGNTSLGAFEQTKQAASSELRKVFSGSGGGNLEELRQFEANLSSSKSPEQIHSVIQNAVELLGSRLNALQDQYAQGMGRSDKTPTFIKPSLARQAQARFGVDLGSGGQSASTASTSPIPAGAKPIGTYKGAPVYLLPNGKKWTP